MSSSKLLFLFLLHLIIALASVSAQLDLWDHECTDDNGNYTANSTFKSNLNALLTKISTNDISYGFYNLSAGKDPDQVYVIGFCRGDVEVPDCHTCLDFVTTNLTGLCPNQKEVIGWADNCMLRYSSRDILGGLWENEPSIPLISGDNVTDLDQFINVLQGLLESLTNRTASGDSRLKYATGEANVTASQKVYALMQCTPDLSEFDCLGCLSLVIRDLIHGDGVRGQTGARVLHPSCYARYEIQKFYSSPDSSPPPPSPNLVTTPSSTATSRNRNDKSKIVIIVVLTAIAPASAQLDLWSHGCFDDNGNYTSNSTYKSNLDKLLTKLPTSNISNGFYNFSEGQEPDQANAIALCRGDVEVADCHTCINSVISQLDGLCPNQKEAIGWEDNCMVRYSSSSMLAGDLVTEPLYLLDSGTNATDIDHFATVVESLLLTLPNKTASGDSNLKFATEEAKLSDSQNIYGLMQCTPDLDMTDCLLCLYLGMYYISHTLRGQTGGRVLYPSCQVRYELQKFYSLSNPPPSPPPQTAAAPLPSLTHSRKGIRRPQVAIMVVLGVLACLSLLVNFAVGYMSPEYARYGFFSVKSDVYSFGVLVLEIVTGQRNCSTGESCEDLINLAWRNWSNGTPSSIVDPMIAATGSESEMTRFINLGLLCVQENIARRPTMSSVVHMLSGQSFNLPVPSEPPFVLSHNKPSPASDVHLSTNSAVVTGYSGSLTDLYPR
ncbi:hypothetical protein V2J09_019342 [Rumex salicifolius]